MPAAALVMCGQMPAFATTDGICFGMANVPAGETLNLRAGPSARAPIRARLGNSSEPILAKDGPCGRWCRVAVYAGNWTKRGWINSRYLRRRECP